MLSPSPEIKNENQPNSPEQLYLNMLTGGLNNETARLRGLPSPSLAETITQELLQNGSVLSSDQVDVVHDAAIGLRHEEARRHEDQFHSSLKTMSKLNDAGHNVKIIIDSLRNSTLQSPIPVETLLQWLQGDVYDSLVEASNAHQNQSEPILTEEARLNQSSPDHHSPIIYDRLRPLSDQSS